jgi:hypothetical protein
VEVALAIVELAGGFAADAPGHHVAANIFFAQSNISPWFSLLLLNNWVFAVCS